MAQKVISAGWFSSLAAIFVLSALDHRFGWSVVPTPVCLLGDALVAVALVVVMLVVVQNSHAAATVRVEDGQKVVSTGLYGLVRHPMYTGNVIMMVAIPLALGSYWGLLGVLAGLLCWPCASATKKRCSGKSWRDTASTHRKSAIAWCRVCGSGRRNVTDCRAGSRQELQPITGSSW